MRFQLTARTGHPDFLDLPWDRPLAAWEHERLVEVPRGLHRHVVRFVAYDGRIYVLKELSRRLAEREYRLLRHLADEGVPAVDVVGVVSHRAGPGAEPLDAVLITEHLRYSLPYRLLFLRRSASELREPMIDALVHLLVRNHLAGFFWGDCSLSNTLFRRDAGRLAAHVVDTETGEVHRELTVGQREHDVEIAIERCGGELLDLQAQGLLTPDADPVELGDELRQRYQSLWDELTRDEMVGPGERYRIHERLTRINELGYDVGELQLSGDDPSAVHLRLQVIEPGRYRRLLRERTGIDALDHQARVLLNDIASFGGWLASERGGPQDEAVVVSRWLEMSYLPTVGAVPADLAGRREPPQLFIEALEHWHRLSDDAGRDVGLAQAVEDYVTHVLANEPDEALATDTMDTGGDPPDAQ